jgi:hypothetical protein
MTNPTNPTKGILPDIAYGGSERSHAFNISDGIDSQGQEKQRIRGLGVALPAGTGPRPEDEAEDVLNG